MRQRELPRHYAASLTLVLLFSAAAIAIARRATAESSRSAGFGWSFFYLGAGFMLLETKSIVQFALVWGSTWSSASLAIASVLVMALASVAIAARVRLRRRWPVVALLLALLAANYALPVGRVSFDSRLAESVFYGALVFSPVLCAGILFSTSYRESSSNASDFGANLLGAMVGGVGEYLSLLTGYKFLLLIVAAFYLLAVATGRRRSARSPERQSKPPRSPCDGDEVQRCSR